MKAGRAGSETTFNSIISMYFTFFYDPRLFLSINKLSDASYLSRVLENIFITFRKEFMSLSLKNVRSILHEKKNTTINENFV